MKAPAAPRSVGVLYSLFSPQGTKGVLLLPFNKFPLVTSLGLLWLKLNTNLGICLQPPHYICTSYVSWPSFSFVNIHANISQKGLGTDLRWMNFPNCSKSKPGSSWSSQDIRTLCQTANLRWHLGRSPTPCFVFVFHQRGNSHVIHLMF